MKVRKTYKLYSGGKFVRSESGRTFGVELNTGEIVQAPLASRKDLRDAVAAAAATQPAWAARSAYNRGQIIYRAAELLDARRQEFVELISAEGDLASKAAAAEVAQAIDLSVSWAGWADKFTQVASTINPVDGPFFNFSYPEPIGVVCVCALPSHSIAGALARIWPALVAGNAVVLMDESWPLSRLQLGEILATSDLPRGVVNLLSGKLSELVPVAASHMGVGALDLGGLSGPLRTGAMIAAAENLKRLIEPSETPFACSPHSALEFSETKTVWHPRGV